MISTNSKNMTFIIGLLAIVAITFTYIFLVNSFGGSAGNAISTDVRQAGVVNDDE